MRDIVFIRQSGDEIGGVEGQILSLAVQLRQKQCFNPVLITDDGCSGFAKSFSEKGFDVFCVPMSRAKILSAAKIITAAKKIEQILSQRNVAVLQSHLFRESIIARVVRRKMKNICHVFRGQVYISNSNNSEIVKSLYYALDKMTSRYVDMYIANGAYMANEIAGKAKIDQKKIESIIDGCERKGQADGLCGNPEAPLKTKIAMIANFTPGKGHDCLIKAMAILKNKGLNVTARLIGGEFTAGKTAKKRTTATGTIKKMAAEMGVLEQLEFYGYTKNIAKALDGIAVVVLPSDSEGTPNCVLEAMSLRKLIVVSDTGGVSEMLQNGQTALLCKAKDAQGFAEILQKVFTQNAGEFEKMRSAAYQRWEDCFTAEKMVTQFIKIYKKLGVL